MKTAFTLLVGFLVTLQISIAREMHTFTNQDGKSIEAELIDMRDGKIRIMANRKTFEVPVASLSAADQEWLKEWDAKRMGGTEEAGGSVESAYTELIFEDDFEKDGFGEQWGHYKSESEVKGGVLIGKTIDINDHAGVDSIKFEGKQDLEIKVKFNFMGETAERFNVWMDDKDYKESHAGHICSVSISPTGGSISDAKTGAFENSIYEKRKSEGKLDDATEAMLKTKTASFALDLKKEKWHELLIQTKGEEVVVSVNGFQVGKLKSTGLSHETKSLVSLTTNINDVHYDDFSVRAAKPAAKAAE
jgi:hypothetical protein